EVVEPAEPVMRPRGEQCRRRVKQGEQAGAARDEGAPAARRGRVAPQGKGVSRECWHNDCPVPARSRSARRPVAAAYPSSITRPAISVRAAATASAHGPEGFDMRGARLLFLHANGFPAGVYRRFLDRLAAAAPVEAFAVIETPPGTPAALRWRRMREQVEARLLALDAGQPGTMLVGHSMGGYLALMAAARALPAHHP